MAEAIFRKAVAERGCDIEVSSVGTWAYPGHAATDEAVHVLQGRGIDLSTHRSRGAEREVLEAADLIVAMTSVHRREIAQLAPGTADKVVLLKELVELALDGELPATSEERVARVLGARRPQWRRALDLDDPIGKPVTAYERTVAQIEIAVEVLVEALCGPNQSREEAAN